MTKLLFGVSDTDECRQAIKTIIRLFGHREEVELTLLHVTPEVLVYAESGIVDYVCFLALQLPMDQIRSNAYPPSVLLPRHSYGQQERSDNPGICLPIE